jgi:hypothetical protein
MRHSNVRATLHWISTFVNVMLHSCSPAHAEDIHGLSVIATIPGNEASLDHASVHRTRISYGEGRSQGSTMTYQSGRKVIAIWQSAFGSGAASAPPALLPRGTFILDCSSGRGVVRCVAP